MITKNHKKIFNIFLIFNVFNSLIMAFQYFYWSKVVGFMSLVPVSWPVEIQRRSIFSFIILSIISYFLLRYFYIRVFKKSNLSYKSFIILFLSIWSHYLSVQYVGQSSDVSSYADGVYVEEVNKTGYYHKEIYEYYSFFMVSRCELIKYDVCAAKNDNYQGYYLPCKTDNELPFYKSLFLKKYNVNDGKGFYVLNGVGPLFNLSITESNQH